VAVGGVDRAIAVVVYAVTALIRLALAGRGRAELATAALLNVASLPARALGVVGHGDAALARLAALLRRARHPIGRTRDRRACATAEARIAELRAIAERGVLAGRV